MTLILIWLLGWIISIIIGFIVEYRGLRPGSNLSDLFGDDLLMYAGCGLLWPPVVIIFLLVWVAERIGKIKIK